MQQSFSVTSIARQARIVLSSFRLLYHDCHGSHACTSLGGPSSTIGCEAWVGKPDAVIASPVSCGIIVAAVQCSSQAMQDLTTGYMTLTSSQAMVMGQILVP